MDANGEVVSTVRIRGGKDPFIVATVGGTSLRFKPTREKPTPCESDAN